MKPGAFNWNNMATSHIDLLWYLMQLWHWSMFSSIWSPQIIPRYTCQTLNRNRRLILLIVKRKAQIESRLLFELGNRLQMQQMRSFQVDALLGRFRERAMSMLWESALSSYSFARWLHRVQLGGLTRFDPGHSIKPRRVWIMSRRMRKCYTQIFRNIPHTHTLECVFGTRQCIL